MIDRIEYHVSKTTDYVEEGRTKLTIAEGYQTKARKVRFQNNHWTLTKIIFLNTQYPKIITLDKTLIYLFIQWRYVKSALKVCFLIIALIQCNFRTA